MALTIEAPEILSIHVGDAVGTLSVVQTEAESPVEAVVDVVESSPSVSSDGEQGPQESVDESTPVSTEQDQEVPEVQASPESCKVQAATENFHFSDAIGPPIDMTNFKAVIRPLVGVAPRFQTEAECQQEDAGILFSQAVESAKLEIADAAVAHAKLVASTKSAKASFDEAIEELQELIAEGWEAFLPKKEVANNVESDDDEDRVHAGNGGSAQGDSATACPGVAATPSASIANDAPVTDWADRPSVELISHGAPKGVISTLAEHGHHTIGRIEKFRAEIALGHEKWPKGIGEAKITKLENAIVEWLTKNRDAAVFEASSVVSNAVESTTEIREKPEIGSIGNVIEIPASMLKDAVGYTAMKETEEAKPELTLLKDDDPPASGPAAEKPKRGRKKKENPESKEPETKMAEMLGRQTQPGASLPPPGDKVPTFDRWESMTDDARRDWIIDRMAYLRVTEVTSGSPVCFAGGRTACRNGHEPETCSWLPGSEMDSWLRGWMVEQSDLERRQAESKAATTKHRETVATGVDLDDL